MVLFLFDQKERTLGMLLYAISVWPISAAVRLRHSRTLYNTDPSTHTVSARCLRQALRASAFYIKRKYRLGLGVNKNVHKVRIHACPAFQLFTNVLDINARKKKWVSLSFCKPRGLQQSHESERLDREKCDRLSLKAAVVF